MTELPPNFSLDRNDFLLDWKHFSQPNNNIGEKLQAVLKACTEIPNKEVQIPFIVGFALLPTAMVNDCPIAVGHGPSGSGKSAISTIISGCYPGGILSADTTYAALRNHIAAFKYYDPETQQYERNFCLVFDDLNAEILDNAPLFTLLKTGVTRSTSNRKIALPGGQTMEFNAFCTKFLTSISPFWELPQFLELKRRCLIFRCEKSLNFKGIHYSQISFNGLEKEVDFFWIKPENRSDFKQKYLQRLTHSHKELIASTATVFQKDVQEVKNLFDSFWDYSQGHSIGDPLTEFLKQETSSLDRIYTQNLKLLLSTAKERGIIENSRAKDVAFAMQSLGWI